MKVKRIGIAVAAIVSMSACGRVVEQLPAPEWPDAEIFAHHRLEQPGPVNFLDFSLAFNGTASNNVEVAFGCDANGDGALAVHETEARPARRFWNFPPRSRAGSTMATGT